MVRHPPVFVALVLIVVLALVYRAAQQFDPAREEAPVPAGTVTLELEDAVMTARDGDRTEWSVAVGRIQVRHGFGANIEDFGSVELTGLRRGRLYEKGKPSASFVADRAVYDRQSRAMTIAGNLRVTGREGDWLAAQECAWSEAEDLMRFPRGARARSRDGEVVAPSVLFSPRARLIQCLQGARGRFGQNTLQAGLLRWDIEKRRVECGGLVSGMHGKTAFTARSARVDLRARSIHVNDGAITLRMEDETEPTEVLR